MLKKVFLLLCILSLSLSFTLPLSGETISQGDLKFISGYNDYYNQTHKTLKDAKKSIYVIMFNMRPAEFKSHPVSILLQDLISAHKRGVKVEVILDEYLKVGREQVPINTNPYNILRKAGVNVYWDSPKVITHTKVVIVDDYISIVGSHNWTVSAFQYNNEASFLVRSKEVAKSFKKHFREVKSQSR